MNEFEENIAKAELAELKKAENITALNKAVEFLGKYQKIVSSRSELTQIKDTRSILNGMYYQLKKK